MKKLTHDLIVFNHLVQKNHCKLRLKAGKILLAQYLKYRSKKQTMRIDVLPAYFLAFLKIFREPLENVFANEFGNPRLRRL